MPLVSKTFSQIITFTRASSATYFDAAGVLQTATTDAPRFDYNPSTLAALGLLIEEARTNSIRNNTMQGAVAGTPGTAPTNWVMTGSNFGITQEIVGTGTQNGITYIDVKISGTSTAASSHITAFESANQIAAAIGQAWTASSYLRVVAGSATGITIQILTQARNAGNTAFTETFATNVSPTATLTRFAATSTLADANTAFIRTAISMAYSNGAAIDITLRIGLPQLEQGAFATSVISTTTTAVTRAADVASVNTLSPWFNAAAGTLYAETQLFNTVAQNRAGFDFNDGSTNNRNIFRAFTTGSADQNTIRSGGSTVATLASATTPTTAVRKSVSAYAANDFAFTADGAVPVTDTLGAVPVGLTTFLLGSAVAGTEQLNGYLRRIVYYPRRLANAELQSITS